MTDAFKIGKYEIRGRLGEGGMGVVYEGHDPVIQRIVALKCIEKSKLDPAEAQFILDRFRREAQAAGRLVHPNIVAVYEYGEDASFAFIAMECVKGKSLTRFMAENPQRSIPQIREIVGQLLEALGYSHRMGVVHRDIKPSNILINEDGQIKVTDFGIARIESSSLTQLGDVLGTPNYMSPEQFLGQTADARSDIYSTGVIVFEMLSGRKPFVGNNAQIMRQVLEEPPPSVIELNPELPEELEAVVQRALAKDPKDRFQSAQEFLSAFNEAATEGPRLDLDLSAAIPKAAAYKPRINPALVNAIRRMGAGEGAGGQAPAPAAGTGLPAGPAAPAPANAARVLFVDDEERILTALRSIFRSTYHVFTALDAKQALEFIRLFRIHLVVSDQRMPGMKGVELLREVKETSPHTVRILLTGYSDLASIVGSINEGEIYRFISKPWNTGELQKTVAEAVTVGLELAEMAAAPQQALPSKMEEAILVVGEDQDTFRALKELFGANCPILYAKDVQQGLAVLQKQPVSLIVADIGAGSEENTIFFKLLKQEHPEILAIVVTTASDSELVIELINQAQIFRFLNKPVNLKTMKSHVHLALARYQSFKAAPQLLKAHQVEKPGKVRESSLGRSILDGLKALRGRLGAVLK
ncbi:MAG: protein kinase [Betaproteobacteria bacterium]|nr:protein kinase [Betaproteobacteria bacterium]